MMGHKLSEPNSVVAQLPTCLFPVNRNNDILERTTDVCATGIALAAWGID